MRVRANFIPERLAARRAEARRAAWAMAIALAVPLLLLSAVGLIYNLATERATTMLGANLRRADDAPTIIQGGWLHAENERLAETRALSVGAHANLARWSDLLRELRDRLPADLWLTHVSVTRPDFRAETPAEPSAQPQALIIRGTAVRAEAVGEYLEALSRSPRLLGTRLVTSAPSANEVPGPEGEPQPAVDFELHSQVREPISDGEPNGDEPTPLPVAGEVAP